MLIKLSEGEWPKYSTMDLRYRFKVDFELAENVNGARHDSGYVVDSSAQSFSKLSTMAWALVPPKPKLFTLARLGYPAATSGQSTHLVETRTCL